MAIPWGGKLASIREFSIIQSDSVRAVNQSQERYNKTNEKLFIIWGVLTVFLSFSRFICVPLLSNRQLQNFTLTLTCNWLEARMHLPSPTTTSSWSKNLIQRQSRSLLLLMILQKKLPIYLCWCRSTSARHAANPFQTERHPNAQGRTQTSKLIIRL